MEIRGNRMRKTVLCTVCCLCLLGAGNLKAYAEIAKRDDFDLLIGSDSKISYGYALGASGAVAGTSNVITEVLVELDKALRNGEQEKAEALQKDIDVLRGVLKLGTVPVVMKRAAELAGITQAGPARKPVLECSAQDDEKIKVLLCGYGIGLSWGILYTEIEKKCILPVIETDYVYNDRDQFNI